MRALVNKKTKHVMFRCPGCDDLHVVNDQWEFNGNTDRPTITPSICVMSSVGFPPTPVIACHCWVRDGMITYLMDCTHKFAGKTMILPDLQGDRQR